jgi:hypothetical protein
LFPCAQLSNGDVYQKAHDELDFEFLGNVRGREWRVQTNVYGNGSTDAGREERYGLPFDPTDEFHHYSILWTQERIMSVTFFISPLASCNSLSDTISMSRPSSAPCGVFDFRQVPVWGSGVLGQKQGGKIVTFHVTMRARMKGPFSLPLFAAAGVG